MAARMMVLLCVAGLVASALAQATRPAGPAAKTYVGFVNGTNVYVRSGPGGRDEYYECTKLNYPDRVTVVGRKGDWLEILPPKGCFSVIRQEFVKPDAAGKTGAVTGDRVRVYAAGKLRSASFWQFQTHLNKRDTVQILGVATDRGRKYYKIVSPKGATFYMFAQYVKPVVGEAATRPAAATQPAGATTRKVVDDESKEEFAAAHAAFLVVEKALQDEYKKPFRQRDLKGLLAKFEAVKISKDSVLKPYVDARIRFLQSAIAQNKELSAIEDLVDQTVAKQKLLELKRKRTEIVRPLPPIKYAAAGVLAASEVFTGGPTAPKRFLVRNTKTGRLGAYVQCTTGKIDLNTYVGKNIGVFGKATYDRNLGLDVVEAERVIVLTEAVELPAPPQPMIKPMPKPKPAPKPATKPAPKPLPKLPPLPTEPRQPATRPAEEPATKPAPQTQPASDPLPSTGLEIVEPATQPTTAPVDENEYR